MKAIMHVDKRQMCARIVLSGGLWSFPIPMGKECDFYDDKEYYNGVKNTYIYNDQRSTVDYNPD